MNQPSPYVIRPMEVGDVPTVAALERLSFPTPWPAASFLYELNHREQSSYQVLLKPETGEARPVEGGWRRRWRDLLGLAEESRVIGYVGFRFRSAEAHVSTIAVHPDWRGKGLGELLLLAALEQALALGSNVVSLEVRASNRVAQALYRKYGFRFTSVYRGYYQDGEDAWLMEVEVRRDTYRARLKVLRQALEARLRSQQADVGQNGSDTL